MIRRAILSLTMAVATVASAQTQMPNAVKIGNEGITITSIPPTAVVQIGTNTPPGVWAPPVSIPANALPLSISCAAGCPSILASADPDPNVLKEIDVQQGSVAYNVGYTDATGAAQTITIPALPPSTSQLVPPTPGTVYSVVLSNVQPVTGSPAVPVLSLFAVQPYVLVGGVLSNFTWNMTINGTLLNCDFGAMSTTGTTTMSCVVPAPTSSN